MERIGTSMRSPTPYHAPLDLRSFQNLHDAFAYAMDVCGNYVLVEPPQVWATEGGQPLWHGLVIGEVTFWWFDADRAVLNLSLAGEPFAGNVVATVGEQTHPPPFAVRKSIVARVLEQQRLR